MCQSGSRSRSGSGLSHCKLAVVGRAVPSLEDSPEEEPEQMDGQGKSIQ